MHLVLHRGPEGACHQRQRYLQPGSKHAATGGAGAATGMLVLILAVPSPEMKAGANLILLNFPICGNGECAHYLSSWLCNLPHQVLLST